MKIVLPFVVAVILVVSIIVVLPVSAAPRAASNLRQQPVTTFVPITGTHTVQQGEWLYCIGRAYQVQPMAIAQASGIPGPYGPYNPYGYYNPYAYPSPYMSYHSYSYYNPYMYYYGYYSPWNYLYPGQVLTIPFNSSTAWYNIPPAPVGPACTAQFTLPAGWPPPQPAPAPYPMPYTAPY